MRLANILLFDDKHRLAYILKEKFMEFVRSKDVSEAQDKLKQWLELAQIYRIASFITSQERLRNGSRKF